MKSLHGFLLFIFTLAVSFRTDTSLPRLIQFKEGARFTRTYYNHKGDSVCSVYYTVKNVRIAGDSVYSTISAFCPDDDESKVMHDSCNYASRYDSLLIIREAGIPSQKFSKQKISEWREGEWCEYPTGIREGQILPEAHFFTHTMLNDTEEFILYRTHVFGRQVEAEEMVQLPIGEWKCMKISYFIDSRPVRGPYIGPPEHDPVKVTEWFSPVLGIVKSEGFVSWQLTSVKW